MGRVPHLFLGLIAIFGVMQAQNVTTQEVPSTTIRRTIDNPEDKVLNDPFDLDELQSKPELFGNNFFGILNSNWKERTTLQKILNIIKNQEPSNKTYQYTNKLLRGYFNAIPDYLNSTEGSGTIAGLAGIVEGELKEIIIKNMENFKTTGEKPYLPPPPIGMSEDEKTAYLMQHMQWSRVAVKALIGRPYELYKPDGVDGQCYTDAVYMLRNFYMLKHQWAKEMLDSMGKFPVGLYQGNLNWIGEYDQCYTIKVDRRDLVSDNITQKDAFHGSYCDIKMELPKSIAIPASPGETVYLRMGLCFPSTCLAKDVKLIMSNVQVAGFQLPKIVDARCHNEAPLVKGEFANDHFAQGALGFMCGFAALVVLATIIDGLFFFESTDIEDKKPVKEDSYNIKMTELGKQNEGFQPDHQEKGYSNGDVKQSNGVVIVPTEDTKPANGLRKKLIQSFSIYSTLPQLLSTKQPKGAIKSLDALRVFNMNWIILGHCYSIGAAFLIHTTSNAKLAVEAIKDWTFQGAYSAMFGVDSFFFISGLLVSYLFLKASKKNGGKFCGQLVMYYIHRLIRILPLYCILILVYAAFGKYLGAGPLFDWESERVRDCNNNWWANLLFINNFVKPREMCLGWSWYLANDMQFYIIAPLMLIPLYLMLPVGIFMVGAVFVAHWASTAVVWSRTNGASFMQDPDIFYEAYIKPYCRIGPYLMGLILGYIMYKGYKITNKFVIAVSWMVTLTIMGTVVYIQYEDTKDGLTNHNWSTFQRTIYETLSRDAWGLAMAWIVYACNTGNAGFVGHILNWRGWIPLGRVTYSAYLVHPLVIFIYAGNRRDLNHVDNFSIAYLYSGYVLLTYVSGAILSLLYEWPFAGLEKLLFAGVKK